MEKYINKNIKLQPVPPSMPSEALSVILSGVNSASNDIDGGTGCNFKYFFQINTVTSTNVPLVLSFNSLLFTNTHRVIQGIINWAISQQHNL